VHRRNPGGVNLGFFPFCPHWLYIVRLATGNVKRLFGAAQGLAVPALPSSLCELCRDRCASGYRVGAFGALKKA